MPSSLLFGINNEGRVHTLSTTGMLWRELPYVGQEFKKLSAVPHFLWALGGDHQVYVYVHGLDIPIRVREESYENERWIPIEGFSSRLLPTDRFRFSSADGTIDRSINDIRLPSMAWQWEGDWQLELTLNGQPLDHDGWTYAVDFPAQYHPKKNWKSCVRRRLWVRSRKYFALNSWCAIAPLHKDATAEPFIDISVGGQSISGVEQGIMVVWAVTSQNRVMFRTGVSTKSPEGAKWTNIAVPIGSEINQLSVGPSGLVWASLLDGRALVRIGVGRESISGNAWVEVRGPGDNLRITQLSVGLCSVWAVTHNKQVWFRKGIKGDAAVINEEQAAGCGWVDMVGQMSAVSVTANDQVFAISTKDRAIHYRLGVSNDYLTGKRWKSLQAPLQVSRASSNASLGRDRFQNKSSSSLNRPSSLCDSSGISEWDEQSHSAPTAPVSLPVGDFSDKQFEIQLKNPKAWSPVRSVGSVVGTEVISDESVYQSERQDSCIFADDEELVWAEYEAPWAYVEAGACTIDPNQLPKWFSDMSTFQQQELDQPWRTKILEDLKARLKLIEDFSNYPAAVDSTSWIHKAEARALLPPSITFIDCILQLEWIDTIGTLTILHIDGASTIHQFSMNDITCTQCCSEPGNPRLVIHTPNLSPSLIKLQFTCDTILDEWQAHLATVTMQIHGLKGRPSEDSLWGISQLGDIFISNLGEKNTNEVIDLKGKEVPFKIPLHTHCSPGTILTVNAYIPNNAERFSINLDSHITYKQRHKAHAEFETCILHINPRFKDKIVVLNSMIEAKWGQEERFENSVFHLGQDLEVKILCKEDDYAIYVNKEPFCSYRHRVPCTSACFLSINGDLEPVKFSIDTTNIILKPKELIWRQLGGHMRRVESCKSGVTWGIGYDHVVWVYNGGWGGGFFSSLDSHNVNPMPDSQDYRVYENQRWNPMTGYTSTGLPTDRFMWSDASGKQKRTRDQVKLLSMHWQWVSDWLVDFHVPGGVDRDGWQYATDFPSNYHANKQFTDCVRRRRWYRRCAVAASGPWNELGLTKLLDVSLSDIDDLLDTKVVIWAIAFGGQTMVRTGVTKSTPMGVKWEHVQSDQVLSSISCGPFIKVWATGKNGCAYFRTGIKEDLLQGEKWVCVEPPNGAQLKQISVGPIGVWAIDMTGRLHVRQEISTKTPEGTHWTTINSDPSLTVNLVKEMGTVNFKQVSVGEEEVWAVTDGGLLIRRQGVSGETPLGSGWDLGIPGSWQHVCIKPLIW